MEYLSSCNGDKSVCGNAEVCTSVTSSDGDKSSKDSLSYSEKVGIIIAAVFFFVFLIVVIALGGASAYKQVKYFFTTTLPLFTILSVLDVLMDINMSFVEYQ